MRGSDESLSVLKEQIEGHLVKARKTGDVSDLRKIVWRAVRAAEQMMFQENATPELVFKAIYAISQIGNTYMKVLEVDELEERVAALEEALANQEGNLRRVA